jgi:hypothetical protein
MESHTAAKESKSACGPQIAQAALQSIGMSTRKFGNPLMGPQEYARAVSLIFTKTTEQNIILGTPPDHVCSTSILWNSLAQDKRFEQLAIREAAPGDIIIEPGSKKAGDGYAGTLVNHGRIVSNSDQGVRDDTHEWADPNVKIEGWSAPFPVSKAQPGDVIAQDHGGGNGHVGIVVGPQKTASADATKDPAGVITVGDFGFRPTVEANVGKPGGSMPVVRRYVGY